MSEPSLERTNRTPGGRSAETPDDAPGAWIDALLREHERSLVAYARSITGDLERGRDCVQEAFLELVRLARTDRTKVEGHVVAWLFRVCRHRALDTRAKEEPMRVADPGQVEPRTAPEQDPARALLHEEALAGVDAGLERLPAGQREVIELKFRHGLAYRAIAEVTGHSVGHVGWLLHHGIKALRAQLTTAAGEDDRRALASDGTAGR